MYFGMNTVFYSKYNFEKAAVYCKWRNLTSLANQGKGVKTETIQCKAYSMQNF